MFIATEYLPPAAVVITVQQPETRELPKLPLVISVDNPVPPTDSEGPGGRTSGGPR